MDHLTALPTELLFHITSFIEPDDLVALLSVNRYFRELSREIWAASLKQLSLKYPKCLDPLDSDVLEEISDLKKFYCLAIRRNQNVLGEWVRLSKSSFRDEIRVKIKLEDAIVGVESKNENCNEEEVVFFAPFDLDHGTTMLPVTKCLKCGQNETVKLINSSQDTPGLLFVSYLTEHCIQISSRPTDFKYHDMMETCEYSGLKGMYYIRNTIEMKLRSGGGVPTILPRKPLRLPPTLPTRMPPPLPCEDNWHLCELYEEPIFRPLPCTCTCPCELYCLCG